MVTRPKVEDSEEGTLEPEKENKTEEKVHEIQLQTRELPRKYYLDNVQVYIAGEQAFELDPDGNVLKTVQFTDYVTENIRRLNLTAEHLKQEWPIAEQRAEILNQLRSRGIDPDYLAHVTHQEEADALDLLLHVAFNAPLVTRRERAEKLRQKKANFFNTFTPAAKEILNTLLEKYADYGIGEFDHLSNVLQVSPFDEYGSTYEIYELFGGAEKMLQRWMSYRSFCMNNEVFVMKGFTATLGISGLLIFALGAILVIINIFLTDPFRLRMDNLIKEIWIRINNKASPIILINILSGQEVFI